MSYSASRKGGLLNGAAPVAMAGAGIPTPTIVMKAREMGMKGPFTLFLPPNLYRRLQAEEIPPLFAQWRYEMLEPVPVRRP